MSTRKVYVSNGGLPATGLTLAWNNLKKVSDGTNYSPQPAFTEIGGGWYKFNIQPTETLVGVIDASVTVSLANERYIPIILDPSDYLYDIAIVPTYDSTVDTLRFQVFMLVNGRLETDATKLTAVSLSIYDNTNTLLFTIAGSALANGMSLATKTTPGLVVNIPYLVVANITYNGSTIQSADTFSSLQ